MSAVTLGAKLAVLVSLAEAVPLAVWLVPYSNMAKRKIVVWLSQSRYARWGSIAGLAALVYHSARLARLLLSRSPAAAAVAAAAAAVRTAKPPGGAAASANTSGRGAESTDGVAEKNKDGVAEKKKDEVADALQARVECLVKSLPPENKMYAALTAAEAAARDAATPPARGSAAAAAAAEAAAAGTGPNAVGGRGKGPAASPSPSPSPSPLPSSGASSSSSLVPSGAAGASWWLQVYQHVMGVLLGLFARRVMWLLKGNEEALFQMEQNAVERDILNFRPPSLRRLETVLKPYEMVMRPKFLGMEQIPTDRPLLFVSNHTIMGFDYPLLLTELYRRKGIFLRVLADHSHFQIPLNADVLQNVLGAVDGTRRNTELLMGQGQCVFVYPGGARETFKRTTDKKYELIWGERMGFVKMALRHGCTIVPVVNVGTEDITRIHYDLPIGWLPVPFLYGSDRTVPVFTPDVSQLQRLYFYFSQPIRVGAYVPKSMSPVEASEDPHVCRHIRDVTRTALEEGIAFLKAYREYDPSRMTSAKTNRKEAFKLARWIASKSRKGHGKQQGNNGVDAGLADDGGGAGRNDHEDEDDDDDDEDDNDDEAAAAEEETVGGQRKAAARRQARELHEWYLKTSRM